MEVDRKPNDPSTTVLKSQSLPMGDCCTREVIVEKIAELSGDDEADVRALVTERFNDKYVTGKFDTTYQQKSAGMDPISFDDILKTEETKQSKSLTQMIENLLEGHRNISECVIAGGGAGHPLVLSAIEQATKEVLDPNAQWTVLPRPSSE